MSDRALSFTPFVHPSFIVTRPFVAPNSLATVGDAIVAALAADAVATVAFVALLLVGGVLADDERAGLLGLVQRRRWLWS